MKNGSSDNSNLDRSRGNDDWWNALFAKDDKQATLSSEQGVVAAQNASLQDTKTGGNIDWDIVAEYFANEALLECKVVACNRGGLLVLHTHFEGFVPLSHILNSEEEVMPNDLPNYIGRILKLRIIEQDLTRSRIILSERVAQAKLGERRRLLNKISNGQSIRGSVTTITKFGVFVDIGGVEGLIHISEISWRRVSQPAALVKIGDGLDVLVLDVDQARQRVALSLKQLSPNPWDSIKEQYAVEDVVMVEITEVVRFGAFAKLNDDLEGLIHISAMNLPDGVHPWQKFRVGQQLPARIQKMNPAEQRLSLILDEIPD